MKRISLSSILLLAFALILCFSLIACNGNEADTTDAPVSEPTEAPTAAPTEEPTDEPTEAPTSEPTEAPTSAPTEAPTEEPTEEATEYVGPDSPACETCNFKTTNNLPICTVCGYVAECRGEHKYASDASGHWKPECELCGKGKGRVQSHEYVERVEDEGDLFLYSYRCSICKFKAYEQEVPYEINAYYSAGELSMIDTSTNIEGGYAFEAGTGYATYTYKSSGAATVNVLEGAEPDAPSGQYAVIKLRIPASQNSFSISIRSFSASTKLAVPLNDLKNGWITVIVDMTKLVGTITDATTGETQGTGYQIDANDEYYLTDFIINAKIGASESLDVAYVMFCDTMEDATRFTRNDKTVYIFEDALNKKPVIEQKPCVDENGNIIEHVYIKDADGHTLEEPCYQCGLAAVYGEEHLFGQTVIDGELTYACVVCGWLRFSTNVNKYFSATDINTIACTYYKIVRNGDEGIGTDKEGKFDYMSFSSTGGTAQILFARNTSDSSEIEEAAAFNVSTARYFIIRMRTNTLEQSFGINFATTGSELYEATWRGVTGMYHTSKTLNFPTAVGGADKWVTYVVDLAAVIPTAYVAEENGEFTIVNFYFHVGNAAFSPNDIFDVHYMAFVDDWDEVAAFVEDESVVKVTGQMLGVRVNTADQTCADAHAYGLAQIDGKTVGKCNVCGHIDENYEVPSISVVQTPDVLIEKNVVGSHITGNMDLDLMEEDGQSFVRLSNLTVNKDGWGGWTTIASSSAPLSGQYMAIKLRVGKNGLGQKKLDFYIGTENKLDGGQYVGIKVSEDGEWHTIIVDLAARVKNPASFFAPDPDGYHVRYLQMRPFTGAQHGGGNKTDGYVQKVTGDMYMDVAYIKIFNKLSDIKDIIDTETYEWSTGDGSYSERNTSDGSCVSHTIITEKDGGKSIVKCSACESVLKEFEVPANINWYSPLDTMAQMTDPKHTLVKNLYDTEANILYNRYSGSGGCHLNVAGGANAGLYTAEKYETGNYIVVKYRLSGTVTFEIATGDFGDNPNLKPPRPMYSDMGIRTHADGLSDWTVALIKIPDGINYTKGSTQQLGIRFTSQAGEYVFDVAYVAVVDSVEEAKLLLEEGETYLDLGESWTAK